MQTASTKTALVACADYEQAHVTDALNRALALSGGLDWVQSGMRVVVKPNLLMKRSPDLACTTHPAVLTAVVQALRARGAHVLVGDSPGGPFTISRLRAVYRECGLLPLVELDAQLNENIGVTRGFFPDGTVLKQIDLCEFIAQADAVVNVAKLKTHSMMGYSGAVKNLFGAIPGTIKAEYHYRMPSSSAFAQMLVDLALYLAPQCNIIDGVVGMEGDGPSQGTPRRIGALIISQNPFHADYAATQLIGADTGQVPTQIEAQRRGLLDGCILDGEPIDSLRVDGFRTIPAIWPTADKNRTGKGIFGIASRFDFAATAVLQPNPKLLKRKCVGCRECLVACPAKAIVMENGKPVIDKNTCIRCFCCQEVCPHSAMIIRRNPVAKMFQKS